MSAAASTSWPNSCFTPGELQAAAEVAQRLMELLLARNALGHVELAADLIGCFEQGHRMAALGGGRPPPQARPAPHPLLRYASCAIGGRDDRVQSRGRRAGSPGRMRASFEYLVETGLVAGDAGVYLISRVRRAALRTHSGSASSGRAMDTMSAWPFGQDPFGHVRAC